MLLAEDLLLLALDDERGTVHASARLALNFGLAAALLTDLTEAERLDLRDGCLHALGNADGLDPLLAEVWAAISAVKPHDVRYWVSQLPRKLRDLRQPLLDGLVREGALERRRERVLLVFHRQVFPERNAQREHDVRERVDAVLLRSENGDDRTRTLAQLAVACGVTDALYPREQRKAVKARAEALAMADDAAGAVDDAVRAARNAAVMAAVIGAGVAATTAATTAACSTAATHC